MLGYNAGGGSAEDDIDLHGAVLRARARDLFDAGGLARSGPMTLKTNVVGWGIQPKPKIDGEALGLSEEAQDEWGAEHPAGVSHLGGEPDVRRGAAAQLLRIAAACFFFPSW